MILTGDAVIGYTFQSDEAPPGGMECRYCDDGATEFVVIARSEILGLCGKKRCWEYHDEEFGE